MADYILIRKGRNALSTATHVILNLLLGVGSIVLTVVTGHWLIGILLVFLSKWRMFAVRRRYWWSSLKANLVDLTAGVSFVLLAYLTGSTWTLAHTLLAIGYTVWLIWIKPKSTPVFTEAQALIALFLGSAVISLIFATLDAVWAALLTFVLASACARHVMSQRDDTNFTLSTLCVGLFGAEAMWLAHTWYIIYVFGRHRHPHPTNLSRPNARRLSFESHLPLHPEARRQIQARRNRRPRAFCGGHHSDYLPLL